MTKKTVLQNALMVHIFWLIMIILVIRSVKSESEIQVLPTKAPTSDEIAAKFHEDINKRALEVAEYSESNSDINNEKMASADHQSAHVGARLYITDNERRNATTGLQQQQIKAFHEKIAGTQLHYIAVNQSNASEYTLTEQRQRMEECSEKNDFRNSENALKCHRYAYSTEKKEVEDVVVVQINNSAPMSLILSSSSRVHWILKGQTQNLKLIYVTGHNASELSGAFSPTTLRFSHFDQGINCSGCNSSILTTFHNTNLSPSLEKQLLENFGKPLDSFQGQHKAKEFIIN